MLHIGCVDFLVIRNWNRFVNVTGCLYTVDVNGHSVTTNCKLSLNPSMNQYSPQCNLNRCWQNFGNPHITHFNEAIGLPSPFQLQFSSERKCIQIPKLSRRKMCSFFASELLQVSNIVVPS